MGKVRIGKATVCDRAQVSGSANWFVVIAVNQPLARMGAPPVLCCQRPWIS